VPCHSLLKTAESTSNDWPDSPHCHVAAVSAPFRERCDWPGSRHCLEAAVAAATMGSCFAGPRQRDSHGPRRFEV